ncbi:MAG TPA: acyl-CoA dehydrogenase family protein, partial [Bdellovibrionota bacterium]|nr:acyl-CoA dehydrogenase family protein [Bdellovibrionota bacterium]
PVAAKHDEEETFNDAAFRKMGPLGVLGITVPDSYGGGGNDAVGATIVMEEFGRCCSSSALSYLAHSILCVNNIYVNGTELQRKKYLPQLCSGEWIGGMAMTEPAHGSDMIFMDTRAEKKKDRYILTGTKTFITNGNIGDIFVVYARTGDQGPKGISAFIVEKGFKGFSVGKKLEKLGMRASPTTELVFDQCEVPAENLLGIENNGTAQMMKTLDIERITISGISLGIARAAVELMLWYGEERKQFGQPILDFQFVQKMLADASMEFEAASALVYKVARLLGKGEKVTRQVAAAKLFAAESATRAGMSAIQVLGGYGYTREYPAERLMRDAKLMEIGAGTNEIMRHIIVRDLRRK